MKLFLFPSKDGVVLKLPQDRMEELISTKKASFLVMGKRTMKQWAVLEVATPVAVRRHRGLYKESRDVVVGS